MTGRPFFATVLLAALVSCSSSGSNSNANSNLSSDSGTPKATGPTADVSEEISGGNGPFIGSASGNAVPDGYVQHEYFAAGTATAYEANTGSSDASLADDGRWTFEPSTTAAYRTRILVLRPANAADFSGTVLIEWLNVSGGVDANPDYASLQEEIVRQHHVWIGVSAQLIGVEGGPVLVSVPIAGASDYTGKGLKAIDPARYGTLSHPGDGYSFDIFTQVARAVRRGGPILGGAEPQFVLAVGESQSAFALTTYYDGVQPLTRAFDGFFVHSRGAVALPLVGPGIYADIAGAIGSPTHPVFRDDLDAPVFELQAESDVTGVLNSSIVRQPDSDRFRLWEVAGTAHADAHLLGSTATSIDCGVPINDGPMHLVAKAAFHGLEAWVRAGTLPPTAPLLELTAATPQAVSRNADGIALGGVRTPPVDVPVDVLSGNPGPMTSLICLLLGSTTPLSDTRLAELYTNRAAYQDQYAAAADQTTQTGFVLDADRNALIAYSQPLRIAP